MNMLNILTVLFVSLQLTNFIDWSWWLVLSPTLFQIVAWVSIIFFIVWKKSR